MLRQTLKLAVDELELNKVYLVNLFPEGPHENFYYLIVFLKLEIKIMINKLINIAREAGAIVREGFGKNFSFEYKTNVANIVTEIDKKSESTIIDFIKKDFPTHNIIAEESGTQSGSSNKRWVIDPLDGTTNFAHGLPLFSVSIGFQENETTVAGVIYDVMQDVMYSAETGSGSYRENQKIKVSDGKEISKSLLVTGFPYDIDKNPYHAIERFSTVLKSSRGVRRLGSAAIDFCYVASGVFDGFWEVHLQPWDICAGHLIVEEAGGIVTDFQGNPAHIFSKQILATNNLIHASMMKLLEI